MIEIGPNLRLAIEGIAMCLIAAVFFYVFSNTCKNKLSLNVH
jgi:hypothetical protein